MDYLSQVAVAGCVQFLLLARRQFVGCAIEAGLFHERQRAIIYDEMVAEKLFRGSKPCREQAPEPLPADLRALTFQAGDRPPGMLLPGPADASSQLQPLADGSDLAERHPGLHHPERSGIHAKKYNAFWSAGEAADVGLEALPRILERVVNVCHRWPESQLFQRGA